MRQIPIRHKQTLLDIAMQEAGTVEAVFELAVANGISITQDLDAKIDIPDDFKNKDRMVIEDYARTDVKPVTGINEYELEGIDFQSIPILIF